MHVRKRQSGSMYLMENKTVLSIRKAMFCLLALLIDVLPLLETCNL